MRDFRSDNRSGGRGGSSRGGFSDRGPRPLYDAVCADCGRDCQVPFRPSGDKPVYCSDCFGKQSGNDRSDDRRGPSRRSFDGRGSDRPSSGGANDRSMSQLTEKIGVLNSKLDRIIDLLSSNEKKETKPAPAKDKPKKSRKSADKKPVEATEEKS